jgi:TRAP-type C4-dicarboxylate transport system substrate-binding protein
MKKLIYSRLWILFMAMALLGCFLMASPAVTRAAETFKLKHSSWVPEQNSMEYAPKLWMKELEKRTGGRVKVTPYYGQSLGKVTNFLDMLDTGICDTALIPTGLFSKDFPILDVLSLPGLIQNRTVGTEVMYALLYRGLLKKELTGYKPVVLQAHDPFYFAFTKKKVTSLEELKGMKIRFPSVTIQSYFEALGATPVSIPPPELFNAVNTGVIDGTSISPGYLVVSKLYEIMKYVSMANPISCGANIVLMSQKTWDRLPVDIQLIIEELNAKAKYQYLDAGLKEDIASIKSLKEAGMDLYRLSPSEVERWQKLAEPVIDQWVRDREAAGYPAKEALETAREVVERLNW